MRRYGFALFGLLLTSCGSQPDTTQNQVATAPTTSSLASAPTPDTRVRVAYVAPVPTPTATPDPFAIPTPLPTKAVHYTTVSLSTLSKQIGNDIIDAPTVDKLEDVRSVVTEINTQLFEQQQDLQERGHNYESAMGPGQASTIMNLLSNAIDSKRSALRNETGQNNMYENQCEIQVRGAISTAQQIDSSITLKSVD